MTDKNKKQRDQDDAKRAQTNIKSACGDDPGTEANRNPLIPPGKDNCNLVAEPGDPKAPKAADDANLNPGTPKKGSSNQDYDEKVSQIDGKYQDPNAQGVQGQRGVSKQEAEAQSKQDRQAEEDAKRARTNIKSACGDDPGTEANRNPLIPPGKDNCDVVTEPGDPKAPKAADDANLNPGTPKKGSSNQDYDEKVSQMDGKYQDPNAQGVQGQRGVSKQEAEAQSKQDRQAEEDAKRARTNIKSACGDDPGTEENRNPLIPPGKDNCDVVTEPADPKAPKAADDANLNPGTPKKGSSNQDYDEKVSQMDGKYQDPNAQGVRGERKRRRAAMANKKEDRGPVAQGMHRLADQVSDSLQAEERLAQAEARLKDLEDRIEPAFQQVWDRLRTLTPGFMQGDKDEGPYGDDDLYQVDPHVLEKIAVKAAESVDGILGLHQGLFKDFTSRFMDGPHGVQVRIEGQEVIVRLKLILDYDAERDQVFEDLKHVMKDRIETATGLKLKAIQVTIEDIMTAEEYKNLS